MRSNPRTLPCLKCGVRVECAALARDFGGEIGFYYHFQADDDKPKFYRWCQHYVKSPGAYTTSSRLNAIVAWNLRNTLLHGYVDRYAA